MGRQRKRSSGSKARGRRESGYVRRITTHADGETDHGELEASDPLGTLPWITPRRLLLLTVLIVGFLGPWPGCARLFTCAFSGYGNLVVRALPTEGGLSPHFTAPTASQRAADGIGDWSVMLSLAPERSMELPSVPMDTRIIGYTPFALFAALLLATPVPTRRRLLIFGIGFGLLLLRQVAAIALPVARALGYFGTGSAGRPFVESVWWAFIASPAMSYVTPLFAWWVGLAVTSPGARPEPAVSEHRTPFRKSKSTRASAPRDIGRLPHLGERHR